MMKRIIWKSIILLSIINIHGVTNAQENLSEPQEKFLNPPNQYRPMPFIHINGAMTREETEKHLKEAKDSSGFGGVAILPLTSGGQFGAKKLLTGTSPSFLSKEYFGRYKDFLEISKVEGMEVIFYDDIDYPSGTAGGILKRDFPQYARQVLVKDEIEANGNEEIRHTFKTDSLSNFQAISAMNIDTKQIIDLQFFFKKSQLIWTPPNGKWRIMHFYTQPDNKSRRRNVVDFMNPEAVSKLMELTYDKYDKNINEYFGNVIKKLFFDDVGFVKCEEAWTPSITTKFAEKYKINPALYYPALYYDIGEETGSTRIAFFDIRSELMAEGYVKIISKWAAKRNLKSIGHPPENYSPNSVPAHGDILKYYRHVDIPLLDAIFSYGRGIQGFKQVSSSADLGDKPLVGAELYGAFPAHTDSLTLYRVAMECMARGVNFIVPHGMWYDSDSANIHIPPLVSHRNPLLKDCLPNYSNYVGRSCMILQGGRRISDIAILWPINSIQYESYINKDAKSGLPVATWLPEDVKHHVLSDILTNHLRRDFTFIHPEDLINGKITREKKHLKLNNQENYQEYKVLIIPGGKAISSETLLKIKDFYENGGTIIATGSLPYRSAEFGKDNEVRKTIVEITGSDQSDFFIKNNSRDGKFIFTKNISAEILEKILDQANTFPDISFDKENLPENKIGYLNYIHKYKNDKDIYFFTNSTENDINTIVSLRGKFDKIQLWNPHTGEINDINDFSHKNEIKGDILTQLPLSIPSVKSVFLICK